MGRQMDHTDGSSDGSHRWVVRWITQMGRQMDHTDGSSDGSHRWVVRWITQMGRQMDHTDGSSDGSHMVDPLSYSICGMVYIKEP